MSGSGYTSCPCCGYDTVSSDMDAPELCSDCIEAGCDPEDGDKRCHEDEDCWDCRGTGIGDPHAQTPCSTCGGRGYPKPEPEEPDDDYNE